MTIAFKSSLTLKDALLRGQNICCLLTEGLEAARCDSSTYKATVEHSGTSQHTNDYRYNVCLGWLTFHPLRPLSRQLQSCLKAFQRTASTMISECAWHGEIAHYYEAWCYFVDANDGRSVPCNAHNSVALIISKFLLPRLVKVALCLRSC